MRSLGAATLAVAVTLSLALVPGSSPIEGAVSAQSCSDKRSRPQRLNLTVNGEKTFGYFALPDGKPKGLVVFGHGHTFSSISWRQHLRVAAQRDHVVAVAMNYRHQPTDRDPRSPTYGRSKGWRVIEGARDSIAAARAMMRRCEPLERRTSVIYGVSMGAHASGLAISSRAKRPNGKPLFDYWFDIEGVVDIVQVYLFTRATGDPIAAEVERDFGGTYEERPAFYESKAIVNRARGIKASGIRGAVMVVATDDPLVEQNTRMFERLRDVGVPAQFFRVRPAGEPVRHGAEIDRTHPVIKTGFDRLAAFFNHGIKPHCFQEFDVDAGSGAITPNPATAPCE